MFREFQYDSDLTDRRAKKRGVSYQDNQTEWFQFRKRDIERQRNDYLAEIQKPFTDVLSRFTVKLDAEAALVKAETARKAAQAERERAEAIARETLATADRIIAAAEKHPEAAALVLTPSVIAHPAPPREEIYRDRMVKLYNDAGIQIPEVLRKQWGVQDMPTSIAPVDEVVAPTRTMTDPAKFVASVSAVMMFSMVFILLWRIA